METNPLAVPLKHPAPPPPPPSLRRSFPAVPYLSSRVVAVEVAPESGAARFPLAAVVYRQTYHYGRVSRFADASPARALRRVPGPFNCILKYLYAREYKSNRFIKGEPAGERGHGNKTIGPERTARRDPLGSTQKRAKMRETERYGSLSLFPVSSSFHSFRSLSLGFSTSFLVPPRSTWLLY